MCVGIIQTTWESSKYAYLGSHSALCSSSLSLCIDLHNGKKVDKILELDDRT